MPAPVKNINAQKHTKKYVLSVLQDVEEGIINGTYTSLERALLSHGLYRQKLHEWCATWRKSQVVSDTIKRILELAKTAIVANTVEGKVPANVGIFLMKAKLGYSDKPEHFIEEVIEEPEDQVDLSRLSDEELEQLETIMIKARSIA